MDGVINRQTLEALAPAGYHIGLHMRYFAPLIEVNQWPSAWVDHYCDHRLILHDPMFRWAHLGEGICQWNALAKDDPAQVIAQARSFGLTHGVSIALSDPAGGTRSFGSFARGDRSFTEPECAHLLEILHELHRRKSPPKSLTVAELEALRMVCAGQRHKEIAYELGVTEGAIKQRLRNAKTKLGAKTVAQAVTLARGYGLI